MREETSLIHIDRARSLTETIRASVEVARSAIVEAYRGRVWVVLGYDSWDAYCEGEFGGVRLRIPAEERQAAATELRGEGLSTRAIGSALGVSKDTIHRDLSTVSDETVEPPLLVDRDTGEVLDQPLPITPDRITGLDGRSRPAQRPEPRFTPSPDILASQALTRLQGRVSQNLWHNITSNLIEALTEAANTPDIRERFDTGTDELGGDHADRYVTRLRELATAANALADLLQPPAQQLRRIR